MTEYLCTLVNWPTSIRARNGLENDAAFRIDWHLVALPIVQQHSQSDPLFVFKQWLGADDYPSTDPQLDHRGDSD